MSWETEEFENADTLDGVRIKTPSGFTMTLNEALLDSVRLLTDLVKRGDILMLPDGQTLYLSPEGALSVLDVDPWLNRNFDFKDYVCNAPDLANVLKLYVESRDGR